eukprot:344465-Prorocentrum_minimum.AAC.1
MCHSPGVPRRAGVTNVSLAGCTALGRRYECVTRRVYRAGGTLRMCHSRFDGAIGDASVGVALIGVTRVGRRRYGAPACVADVDGGQPVRAADVDGGQPVCGEDAGAACSTAGARGQVQLAARAEGSGGHHRVAGGKPLSSTHPSLSSTHPPPYSTHPPLSSTPEDAPGILHY